MKLIIRLSAKEEARALPILLRHSPGMGLPERTYVIAEEAARLLQQQGIRFTELSSEAHAPEVPGGVGGERI